MENFKILLIDTPQDILLIQDTTLLNVPNASFHFFTSVPEAKKAIKNETPDLIMIGSGKLMEDFDFLTDAKNTPTVILCESDGFDVLLRNNLHNVFFVTRPLDIDDIPEVFKKALEFWTWQKERS